MCIKILCYYTDFKYVTETIEKLAEMAADLCVLTRESSMDSVAQLASRKARSYMLSVRRTPRATYISSNARLDPGSKNTKDDDEREENRAFINPICNKRTVH